MLMSFALIFLGGITASMICDSLKIPKILGMIIVGILIGPYSLNLLSKDVLTMSHDLREVALIIILTRAGLSLDLKDLKAVGRPALLMCFLPALFEFTAITILGPIFLGISMLESAILGTIVAAVSPAIVVPRMIYLLENKFGTNKSIPQLVMAGSSVDDIFVIILFTALLNTYSRGTFNLSSLINIPISILSGLGIGIACGKLLSMVFKHIRLNTPYKTLIILGFGFLLVTLESLVRDVFIFSSLLSIMTIGITILKREPEQARSILNSFSRMWQGAEILLFVLVGAIVDITTFRLVGVYAILLIILALLFRIVGVNICLIKTPLNSKERLFCSFSYLPKATVQAAIGAIPLSLGIPSGNIMLSITVLAIFITAPLGAILIDRYHQLLLNKG